jgi:membrane fusion protein (multidrug efflux system)
MLTPGRAGSCTSGPWAAVLGLAVLACACGLDGGGATWREGGGGTADEERTEEAVPVEVETITRGPIEATLRFSATLEAELDVEVFAEASRRVVELAVEEGDRVAKGALLVRLQDDEQRSALAKAEITLEQAEREWQRQESLYEQSLISEQVWIDARAAHDQARLALDDARRQLGYTQVRAPIAGTVTRRLVNLGDHVTLNQALFRVIDFDSIVARVYVPEKELPRLAPGLPSRVMPDALGDVVFAGVVDRIAPAVDPSTGTVKVTVSIPRQQGLRPGMYVQVELVTAVHEDAVLLPKRALVYDNEQMYVFRLGEARRVERVEIVADLQSADVVEPAGGLEAGDEIVVAGQSGLKDGALVRLPGDPEPTEAPDSADDG